ncbi:family with sequence similarity member a [Lynx pardinus]|uniref:Family with sequence similarity member a n=1 Tax=Lynx pardinus TaxID=191816 RepID=A0A485MIS8_LYNPA|nr:family with sequence similarity member a [Lynx pardinus]
MYQSIHGCCICRAKSSSSRFTDSKRYEKDFQSCFGLHETCSGDICNACVLLVKRQKKLPAGLKKKNKKQKLESCGRCKGRTQSEDNIETKESLTYWKRQKIRCRIIYKGRFGEVLIDTHLFKPCCSNKKAAAEKPEEQGPEPLPISTQEW